MGAEQGDLSQPLAGLRVLELGGWWSVAAAGETLAALGAEVIKVEPPQMDGWRLTAVDPSQDRPWERGPLFNTFNLNKLGMALDLSHARGVEVFLRLVERSDVLLENFSPRVMPNLGLGYPVLAEVNPSLIMVSISAYGATGPWRDFVAHGLGFEQASGLASVTGYRDDDLPRCIQACSDPVVGLWAALAVVGALEFRRRTGRGQHIDLSAVEGLTTFLGAAIAGWQLHGTRPPRLGDRSLGAAPHNVYPCAGDDAWVAIAVLSDEDWLGLRRALGDPVWARDEALLTLEGRRAQEDRIDEHLRRWTSERDPYRVMDILQGHGIACGVVLGPDRQTEDPNLRATEHFAVLDREVIGSVPYPRLPVWYNGRPPEHRTPAPLFGQHNQEVLRDLLGLDTNAVEQLQREGVIASIPRGYG